MLATSLLCIFWKQIYCSRSSDLDLIRTQTDDNQNWLPKMSRKCMKSHYQTCCLEQYTNMAKWIQTFSSCDNNGWWCIQLGECVCHHDKARLSFSVFFSVLMVCLVCGQIFMCNNILNMQDIRHDTDTQSSRGEMATCRRVSWSMWCLKIFRFLI